MTRERFELCLRWPHRTESPEECAERFAQMIAGLAAIDPVLARWRTQILSGDESCDRISHAPFYELPIETEKLARLFDQSRRYKRYPPGSGRAPEVWPEMGFHLSVWNGLKDACSAGIGVYVGANHLNQSRAAHGLYYAHPNNVNLQLPERRLTPGKIWTGSELKPVLMAAVEAWTPDFAMVMAGRYEKFIPRNENGKYYCWPWAGWLTYLSPPRGLLMTPPQDAKSERFADGGLLVTLCEEPFDVDNPQHMAVADEMQRALRPVQW